MNMMTRKEIKQERDSLVEDTGLIWKGKNVFKMAVPIDGSTELFRLLIIVLQENGYVMGSIDWGGKWLRFHFEKNEGYQWFVNVKLTPYKASMLEIFDLITTNFKPNGYSGTNEWKHDMCKRLGVPMTGRLDYLNPSNGYWDGNELKNKLKKGE